MLVRKPQKRKSIETDCRWAKGRKGLRKQSVIIFVLCIRRSWWQVREVAEIKVFM